MHARACVASSCMRAPKISLCQRSRLSLGTQTNRRDMPWALLDDPCFGVYKSLFVAASCSKGNGRVSTVTPPPPPPSASAGITVPAQQSFVLEIPAGAVADTSEPVFMWGGDRWQSAPDRFKSHDFLVWVPFYFTNNGVEPLTYNKTWELAVA
eukprot:COSAG02_NODE_5819_length_4016_cov_1.859586_3_plen_153_part_00